MNNNATELSYGYVDGSGNLKEFFNEYIVPYSLQNHVGSSGFLHRCMPLVEKHGDNVLLDIDASSISKLLNEVSVEFKETTKARYLKAWNKLFNIAKEHDFIEKNPCKSVPKPNAIQSSVRVLSLAEVDALVEGAVAYPSSIHPSAILFGLFTGLPLERIRSLEWSWVSDDFLRLKTSGLSDKKSIDIDLNIVAQAIVKNAVSYAGTTYIFPALDREKKVISTHMSKPKRCFNQLRSCVQDKAGVVESFNSFDLRKTYKHYFQGANNEFLSKYLKLISE